jgi:hypothetical protein
MRKTAIAAGTVGAAAVLPFLSTTSASAATTSDWNRLASCESGGNWHINTGNGYYGGLQFSAGTWRGYGGGAYASRADLASPAQQMAIANRVLRGQGWGAWPACSTKMGLRGHSTSGGATTASGTVRRTTTVHRAPAARRVAPHASRSVGTGRAFIVRSGDTLSKLAAQHGVRGGWRALWAANRGTVRNPNMIFVGQRLRLP